MAVVPLPWQRRDCAGEWPTEARYRRTLARRELKVLVGKSRRVAEAISSACAAGRRYLCHIVPCVLSTECRSQLPTGEAWFSGNTLNALQRTRSMFSYFAGFATDIPLDCRKGSLRRRPGLHCQGSYVGTVTSAHPVYRRADSPEAAGAFRSWRLGESDG